jgi:hypothetical protein
MFAVSLAGSLFFSISPDGGQGQGPPLPALDHGPFAVVAPALGPVIDRSRGARRATVVVSALGRAVLCPFLARDIHSLLLFPEAFAMLVLSKVYLVTKGALVPGNGRAWACSTRWSPRHRRRRRCRPTARVSIHRRPRQPAAPIRDTALRHAARPHR